MAIQAVGMNEAEAQVVDMNVTQDVGMNVTGAQDVGMNVTGAQDVDRDVDQFANKVQVQLEVELFHALKVQFVVVVRRLVAHFLHEVQFAKEVQASVSSP